MRRPLSVLPLILLTTVFSSHAMALETGEIQLKQGFIDSSSGVKVEKIVTTNDQQLQEVTISVPESVGTIGEVVVVAPGEKERTVPQKKRFEMLKDYEHGRYGLVIYLGEKRALPLRLYFANEQAAKSH